MNAGFQIQDTNSWINPNSYQGTQFMNPEYMNYATLPYLQQFYLNFYVPQQQMFPLMTFQPPIPIAMINNQEQRMVFQNSSINGDSQLQPKLMQNIQLNESQSPTDNKQAQEEDDSSSRVNGHWTKQEHQLYLEFVRNHDLILKSKYDKKSKKVFKLMSQFIPTRTATQCRSHHQKFNPLVKGKKKMRSSARQVPRLVNPQIQEAGTYS